jgi:nicotinate phosphoribosyltransferase
MYQISMAYSYWKNGKHMEEACFELFFRDSPFKGEFTIFAGLEEVVRMIVRTKTN